MEVVNWSWYVLVFCIEFKISSGVIFICYFLFWLLGVLNEFYIKEMWDVKWLVDFDLSVF